MKNIKYLLMTLIATMLVATTATPMKRELQEITGNKRMKLDPEKLETIKNAVQAVLAHNSNRADNVDSLHDDVKEQLRTNENIKTYVVEALKQIHLQQAPSIPTLESTHSNSAPASSSTVTPPVPPSSSTPSTPSTDDYKQKYREEYEKHKQDEAKKQMEEKQKQQEVEREQQQKQAAEQKRKALELEPLRQQLDAYLQTLDLINNNQGNLDALQIALIEHTNQSLNKHLQAAIVAPNQDGIEIALGCLTFVCSEIEVFIAHNQQNIAFVTQQCKQSIDQITTKIFTTMLTTYPQQLKDTAENKKNIKQVITVVNLLRERVVLEPFELVQESETAEQAEQRRQEEETHNLLEMVSSSQIDQATRNQAQSRLNQLIKESKQPAQKTTNTTSHATHDDTKDVKKESSSDTKPTHDRHSATNINDSTTIRNVIGLADEDIDEDDVVSAHPQPSSHQQQALSIARLDLLHAILNKNCPLYALTTEQAQQGELFNGNPTDALIIRINAIYFQNYTDTVLVAIQNTHHADPALIISLIKDRVSGEDLLSILAN